MDPIHNDFIKKNYTKEVEQGWMLPIHKDIVQQIQGGGVIPIGIATQHTVNEKGQRIKKHYLTHDCSNCENLAGLLIIWWMRNFLNPAFMDIAYGDYYIMLTS